MAQKPKFGHPNHFQVLKSYDNYRPPSEGDNVLSTVRLSVNAFTAEL